MPTTADCIAKWSARLLEWRALNVHASGEKLAAEVIEDFRALAIEDALTLREASLLGGYSVDHLQRLVRQGTLANHGRKGAPRIARGDVPTKPGHGSAPLPLPGRGDQLSARRRIVADAQPRTGA